MSIYFYLLGWLLANLIVGFMGRHRALGFWGFFIASVLLTPILVALMLVLTSPRKPRQPAR